MIGFLKQIIIGPEIQDKRRIKSAIKHNWINLIDVWADKSEPTFGLERILKLFLIFIQFFFISLYIKEISGWGGLIARKLITELYVIIKLILPIIYLKFGLFDNKYILILNLYLILETFFYLMSLIFLSDVYKSPISNKRSVLLVILNYIEVTLSFAVFYRGLNVLNKPICTFQSIYYSFVTSTTLGYGDFYPDNNLGYFILISQVFFLFLLTVIFITYFVTEIKSKNFYKEK